MFHVRKPPSIPVVWFCPRVWSRWSWYPLPLETLLAIQTLTSVNNSKPLGFFSFLNKGSRGFFKQVSSWGLANCSSYKVKTVRYFSPCTNIESSKRYKHAPSLHILYTHACTNCRWQSFSTWFRVRDDHKPWVCNKKSYPSVSASLSCHAGFCRHALTFLSTLFLTRSSSCSLFTLLVIRWLLKHTNLLQFN